jgi:nucleolin
MGKSTTVKKGKSSDPLSKVKNAGVTKAAESPKAKSKALAKEVASKSGKKEKKSKKVESSSESSESEEESEAESSDDSDSSSEEEEKPKKKVAAKKAAASDSESSDDSDSDSSSEEEEKPKANGAKKAAAKKEESDSDSDSSEDEEEEKKEEAKTTSVSHRLTVLTSPAHANPRPQDSDSDSDSDSSDSDEEEKPAEKAEEAPKKRKALDDPVIPAKKAKTEESAASATLFVGSLAWAVNDDILYQAFSEFPDLVSARVITDREGGRSRGFGYVDFSSEEAAKTALEAKNGSELEGRAMNIDFSGAKPTSDNPRDRASNRADRHGDSVSPESDTLFVGNLSFDIDQDSVRDFFAGAGEVTGVRLPTDP